MTTEHLTIEELTKMGFKELEGEALDNNGFYRWWGLQKNDSELHVTYEYNNGNKMTNAYLEFNGAALGKKNFSSIDVKILIELM
jgi:hypothetical protein